jgi:thiamine biosynthesis lipoprotein
MPRFSALLCILALAQLSGACAPADQRWQLNGQTMGTGYSISVARCPAYTCDDALAGQIEGLLENVTQQMSHFDPESELSLFNAYNSTDWYPVSVELATIVRLALSISDLSNGAFDITVAPAVDAWGFGPTGTSKLRPADEAVEKALTHSGWQKLAVGDSASALRKADAQLRIDLSAIAKGFAVDQIAYQLELNDVNNYLVEIGGEIRTAGVRADGNPWRIGIEPPDDGLDIRFIIVPGDNAVATSGDYINYRMLDGKRIAHTIDPRTARPVKPGLASVSVIDVTASRADALATALMVMGPDQGQAFAAEHELAVLFMVRSDGAVTPVVSAAFDAFLAAD